MSAPRPTGSQARTTLGVAATLGLAADYLLWHGPGGPGWTAWIALLGVSAILLVRRSDLTWTRSTAGWTAVAVLASAIPMVRAAPELMPLSFVAVLLAASMVVLRARGRVFGRTRVADHVHGALMLPVLASLGTVLLLVRADLTPVRGQRRRMAALGRGVLLAIPPVVIFGALFAAADPVFARYTGYMSGVWTEQLPTHVLLVLGFGWVAGGLLAGTMPASSRNPLAAVRPPRVGVEEIALVLGSVSVLFSVFVLIQLPYLFGGQAVIESTTGLTLAEYARRGFFELVTVAGLVLMLLLLAGAAAPRGAARWVFRALAMLLVGLVLVVIASAGLRLRLYVDEFGLTITRLYVGVFMMWLTATLVWFGATVARGRPRRFAAGAVAAGFAAIFGLAAANPDVVIARTNLERDADRVVDASYLHHLSADAVPVLLSGLDRLDGTSRCRAAERLLLRWGPAAEATGRTSRSADWRRWNAAELRARQVITEAAPRLKVLVPACADPSPEGAPVGVAS